MRIISRRTLRDFVNSRIGSAGHSALKSSLEAWFAEVSQAKWMNAAELKMQYRTASIVASDRAVFNIKGNDYRLVVAIDYEKSIVWIKWMGTHREYDGIDVVEVKHER